MENLLPAVANIDVTSNDFREAALPYQQWEAKRTQCLPSTPSDVGHLLPPIGGKFRKPSTKGRHDGTPPPAPPPPRASNTPLPHPAPVDRNLAGLYDPALDPSPIGMEERGATQPVRITRIVPCSDPSAHRHQISGKESGRDGNLNTIVTIFNGYREELRDPGDEPDSGIAGTEEGMLWWENGKQREDRFDDEDGINRPGNNKHQSTAGVSAVDVFVQGFSNGIEHTALLPSETFRRSLQQHRSMRSRPPRPDVGLFSEVDPEKLACVDFEEEEHDGYLGLTILLSSAGDWFGCSNEVAPQQEGNLKNNQHVDAQSGGIHSEPTARVDAAMQTHGPEPQNAEHSTAIHSSTKLSPRDKATRILFQRDGEDGQPVPARSAFRVQFEPGPLGMELEENPLQRGIVQVRRILQAGQAEQDGRLSPGFLLVAVGDWEQQPTGLPSSQEKIGTTPGSILDRNGHTDTPTPIRSLVDFEKAASRRDPDRLFNVWALDRLAPEAIAALGNPATPTPNGTSGSFEIGLRSESRQWSARSLLIGHSQDMGKENDKAYIRDEYHRYSGGTTGSEWTHRGGGGGREWISLGREGRDEVSVYGQKSSLSTRTAPDVVGGGNHLAGTAPEGEAPGWEKPRDTQGVHVDHHFKRSFSRGVEGPTMTSSALAQGTTQSADGISGSALGLASALTLLHVPQRQPHSMDYSVGNNSSDNMPLSQKGRSVGSSRRRGEEGTWEFETGGGMFDENDQGLAARRKPHQGDAESSSHGTREDAGEKRPVLPLGLQASAADDVAVFIWFCNNHESSVLQVSWIDYDGRLIPRRSLEPGACYFERSFASHPWVLQHHATINRNCARRETLGRKTGSEQQSERRAAAGDGDCCVVRLGDAMAVARVTGSLLWNPSNMTLSFIRQAKVGVAGPSIHGLSEVGKAAAEGEGIAPGKKRLCMAGAERETEATRSAEERARVRNEKLRILNEMRAWRTHPPVAGGAFGVGDSAAGQGAIGGLGEGTPNLRVVMVGSSSLTGHRMNHS